jgi:hypothetical protein
VWPPEIPGLVTAGDLTAVSGPAAPVRATTA